MATYVAVRGHFELPDGSPAAGTVRFAPKRGLQDTSTGEWVLPPLVVTLDAAGKINGSTGDNLRALDEAGMVPGGYYEVTVAIQGADPVVGVLFVYVADAGTGVDLSARLQWTPPGSPPDAYVLLPVFTAHVADVTDAHGLSLVGTLLGAVARVAVAVAGVAAGARRQINLIAGSNVTISAADNPGTESLDVTISATGGGGGMINPMTLAWDIIVGGALGAPTRLARGQVGQRLIMDPNRAIIWGDAPPGYEAVPYAPPPTGAGTLPETHAYALVPPLIGDLTLTLRDAYNLNLSTMIAVKAGLRNGHTLTLGTQDGNTIDGGPTYVVPADNAGLLLIGDPSTGEWRVVAVFGAGSVPPLAGIGASFTAPGDAQYGLTCALTLDASSPYITGTGTYAYYRAPAASPTVFSAITTSTVFAVHDVLKITCLSNTGTTSATLPRTA